MSRTELGRDLKKGFEAVGRVVAEGGMAPLSVAIGDVVIDFEPRFSQAGKAAAIEQIGFEAATKRFGAGIIVAVTAPTHTLQGSVAGQQGLAVGGRILTALVGMNHEPGRGLKPGRSAPERAGALR